MIRIHKREAPEMLGRLGPSLVKHHSNESDAPGRLHERRTEVDDQGTRLRR